MKAIKNETELKNTRLAHLRDGVAFTKFMYWLKTNVGKIEMDEYTVGCYLDSLRAQQEHFLDLSFEDISAYGPNAAMMHYAADKETAAPLKPEGFYLIDSGGHYLEGTTDITRTIVLGPLTEQQKLHFTTVCVSNMNLANAKFLYGCRGLNLDILCRGPLWQMALNYKCGTGHGVGHILNVHEGPNGIRWQVVPERSDSGVLEAGMITTDEPGVYLEGEYGIRTENELICVKEEKNEYGQFMAFENITYAPIDLDGIDPEEMTGRERGWLNDYHKMVYEKISPFLTDEEREWLKVYTREI
jgi:Xaa-Pro aminopeptidase